MQGFDFPAVGAMLFAAALVAIVTQRLRLPYSVGLVAAGVALALIAPGSTPPLTRDLIFLVFLPPLVFEAAIQIPWAPLRRDLPLITVLVTAGVVIAAGAVTLGLRLWLGWSWIGAGLFGVLIAATDPVAVIAAFKQLNVEPRLHLLVESESLLNDGVAAVGFTLLAGIAQGQGISLGGVAWSLVENFAGGIACGAAVAVPLILLAGRTSDRLVELTITYLIAYGSFLLADHLGVSGVLAALTAGIIVGNWGFAGAICEGRARVLGHWEFVAFVINSAIFLLIGGHEAKVPVLEVAEAVVAGIVLSLAGRALATYPLIAAFARTRLAVPWSYGHVLFWGGLRGALALALALALPQSVRERGEIILVAFGVVAFSIVVQGLTMGTLIHRLGLRQEEGDDDQGTSTVSTASASVSGQSSV